LEGTLSTEFDTTEKAYIFDHLYLIGIPGSSVMTLAFTT